MSQSPATPDQLVEAHRADSSYRRQIDELNRRLNAGESLSGRERHCAFLNPGTAEVGQTAPRSATISALSGFDFMDDGRGLALVDWDHDGDLDVWVANRTAPRVRFLRNEQAEGRSWLALRLEGASSNRDGIGARVEVTTEGRVFTKSLRAGEGYLSQSTKWLHFGLGSNQSIRHVAVQWPAGDVQVFNGLRANTSYHLREGGDAKEVSRTPSRGPEKAKPLALPAESQSRSVVLTSRLAMPPLALADLEQSEAPSAIHHEGKWTLLNLWASWCEPCRRELSGFNAATDALSAAEIGVLALSVDGLAPGNEQASTLDDARRFERELRANFAVGLATPETVERLQWAYDYLFQQKLPLGVPTSFLLDSDGRLAAVYAGPVTPEKIIADTVIAALPEARRIVTALPFPGRWIDGRRRPAPIAFAADVAGRGHFLDASAYVRDNWEDLMTDGTFADFAGQLGNALMSNRFPDEGFRLLAKALESYPNHVPLMNNYAYHRATHADRRYRDGEVALRWATRAAEATRFQMVPILDTLAAAYAESGRFDEAVETMDRAIRLLRDPGQRQVHEASRSRYANRERP